jgi:uncharacterized membrane-anchored protein
MNGLKIGLAALVALIQTGVLGYMIESRASILRHGREVVLATEPVDPNDLMRGDYVILSYPISLLDKAVLQGAEPATYGANPVYVALKPGPDARWVVSRASWVPIPDQKPDEVALEGSTADYWSPGSASIAVTYGIERFYVPEGEGRPIEEGVGQKRVDVVLSVNADGKAQIRGLRLDGANLYEEPLY